MKGRYVLGIYAFECLFLITCRDKFLDTAADEQIALHKSLSESFAGSSVPYLDCS
jgi:hypothetical protein